MTESTIPPKFSPRHIDPLNKPPSQTYSNQDFYLLESLSFPTAITSLVVGRFLNQNMDCVIIAKHSIISIFVYDVAQDNYTFYDHRDIYKPIASLCLSPQPHSLDCLFILTTGGEWLLVQWNDGRFLSLAAGSLTDALKETFNIDHPRTFSVSTSFTWLTNEVQSSRESPLFYSVVRPNSANPHPSSNQSPLVPKISVRLICIVDESIEVGISFDGLPAAYIQALKDKTPQTLMVLYKNLGLSDDIQFVMKCGLEEQWKLDNLPVLNERGVVERSVHLPPPPKVILAESTTFVFTETPDTHPNPINSSQTKPSISLQNVVNRIRHFTLTSSMNFPSFPNYPPPIVATQPVHPPYLHSLSQQACLESLQSSSPFYPAPLHCCTALVLCDTPHSVSCLSILYNFTQRSKSLDMFALCSLHPSSSRILPAMNIDNLYSTLSGSTTRQMKKISSHRSFAKELLSRPQFRHAPTASAQSTQTIGFHRLDESESTQDTGSPHPTNETRPRHTTSSPLRQHETQPLTPEEDDTDTDAATFDSRSTSPSHIHCPESPDSEAEETTPNHLNFTHSSSPLSAVHRINRPEHPYVRLRNTKQPIFLAFTESHHRMPTGAYTHYSVTESSSSMSFIPFAIFSCVSITVFFDTLLCIVFPLVPSLVDLPTCVLFTQSFSNSSKKDHAPPTTPVSRHKSKRHQNLRKVMPTYLFIGGGSHLLCITKGKVQRMFFPNRFISNLTVLNGLRWIFPKPSKQVQGHAPGIRHTDPPELVKGSSMVFISSIHYSPMIVNLETGVFRDVPFDEDITLNPTTFRRAIGMPFPDNRTFPVNDTILLTAGQDGSGSFQKLNYGFRLISLARGYFFERIPRLFVTRLFTGALHHSLILARDVNSRMTKHRSIFFAISPTSVDPIDATPLGLDTRTPTLALKEVHGGLGQVTTAGCRVLSTIVYSTPNPDALHPKQILTPIVPSKSTMLDWVVPRVFTKNDDAFVPSDHRLQLEYAAISGNSIIASSGQVVFSLYWSPSRIRPAAPNSPRGQLPAILSHSSTLRFPSKVVVIESALICEECFVMIGTADPPCIFMIRPELVESLYKQPKHSQQWRQADLKPLNRFVRKHVSKPNLDIQIQPMERFLELNDGEGLYVFNHRDPSILMTRLFDIDLTSVPVCPRLLTMARGMRGIKANPFHTHRTQQQIEAEFAKISHFPYAENMPLYAYSEHECAMLMVSTQDGCLHTAIFPLHSLLLVPPTLSSLKLEQYPSYVPIYPLYPFLPEITSVQFGKKPLEIIDDGICIYLVGDNSFACDWDNNLATLQTSVLHWDGGLSQFLPMNVSDDSLSLAYRGEREHFFNYALGVPDPTPDAPPQQNSPSHVWIGNLDHQLTFGTIDSRPSMNPLSHSVPPPLSLAAVPELGCVAMLIQELKKPKPKLVDDGLSSSIAPSSPALHPIFKFNQSPDTHSASSSMSVYLPFREAVETATHMASEGITDFPVPSSDLISPGSMPIVDSKGVPFTDLAKLASRSKHEPYRYGSTHISTMTNEFTNRELCYSDSTGFCETCSRSCQDGDVGGEYVYKVLLYDITGTTTQVGQIELNTIPLTPTAVNNPTSALYTFTQVTSFTAQHPRLLSLINERERDLVTTVKDPKKKLSPIPPNSPLTNPGVLWSEYQVPLIAVAGAPHTAHSSETVDGQSDVFIFALEREQLTPMDVITNNTAISIPDPTGLGIENDGFRVLNIRAIPVKRIRLAGPIQNVVGQPSLLFILNGKNLFTIGFRVMDGKDEREEGELESCSCQLDRTTSETHCSILHINPKSNETQTTSPNSLICTGTIESRVLSLFTTVSNITNIAIIPLHPPTGVPHIPNFRPTDLEAWQSSVYTQLPPSLYRFVRYRLSLVHSPCGVAVIDLSLPDDYPITPTRDAFIPLNCRLQERTPTPQTPIEPPGLKPAPSKPPPPRLTVPPQRDLVELENFISTKQLTPNEPLPGIEIATHTISAIKAEILTHILESSIVEHTIFLEQSALCVIVDGNVSIYSLISNDLCRLTKPTKNTHSLVLSFTLTLSTPVFQVIPASSKTAIATNRLKLHLISALQNVVNQVKSKGNNIHSLSPSALLPSSRTPIDPDMYNTLLTFADQVKSVVMDLNWTSELRRPTVFPCFLLSHSGALHRLIPIRLTDIPDAAITLRTYALSMPPFSFGAFWIHHQRNLFSSFDNRESAAWDQYFASLVQQNHSQQDKNDQQMVQMNSPPLGLGAMAAMGGNRGLWSGNLMSSESDNLLSPLGTAGGSSTTSFVPSLTPISLALPPSSPSLPPTQGSSQQLPPIQPLFPDFGVGRYFDLTVLQGLSPLPVNFSLLPSSLRIITPDTMKRAHDTIVSIVRYRLKARYSHQQFELESSRGSSENISLPSNPTRPVIHSNALYHSPFRPLLSAQDDRDWGQPHASEDRTHSSHHTPNPIQSTPLPTPTQTLPVHSFGP